MNDGAFGERRLGRVQDGRAGEADPTGRVNFRRLSPERRDLSVNKLCPRSSRRNERPGGERRPFRASEQSFAERDGGPAR